MASFLNAWILNPNVLHLMPTYATHKLSKPLHLYHEGGDDRLNFILIMNSRYGVCAKSVSDACHRINTIIICQLKMEWKVDIGGAGSLCPWEGLTDLL